MNSACSVRDRCGPTGVECSEGDRACQDRAIHDGLEILCEVKDVTPERYVYCPPGAASRDSNVVWLLLVVAVLIATVGGTVFYVVIRKKEV